VVLNVQVEEEATIMWPSPSGTRIRQLGLSFAMGKLQQDMKHTILDFSFNSLLKQKSHTHTHIESYLEIHKNWPRNNKIGNYLKFPNYLAIHKTS